MAEKELKSIKDVSNALAQQMGEGIAKAAFPGVAGRLTERISSGVLRDYEDLKIGTIEPLKGMDVTGIVSAMTEMHTMLGRDFELKVDELSALQRATGAIVRAPEPVTFSLAQVSNPMPGLTREHIAATNRLNEEIAAQARFAKTESHKSQRTSTIIALLSILIALGSLAVAIIK